jgi:hypothetical protein
VTSLSFGIRVSSMRLIGNDCIGLGLRRYRQYIGDGGHGQSSLSIAYNLLVRIILGQIASESYIERAVFAMVLV